MRFASQPMSKLVRLTKQTAHQNPITQFQLWYKDALSMLDDVSANTMALGTCCIKTGFPSVRMVLLKGVDEKGFRFFTNYKSRKAKEIEKNPKVALCFYWTALKRQVRVEGFCEKLSPEESDQYFNSRPLGSRIGACVSKQSEPLESREAFERELQQFSEKVKQSGTIKRPEHWGGYRVKPVAMEFWQEGQDRLHDRFRYTFIDYGSWKLEMLYP